MPRIALYVRVSTVGKGQDTDNQLTPLREYAKQVGVITNEYVDNYSAGQGKQRAGFNQMMEDARLKKFDILIFWSLDRFSREGVLATLQHLQKLTSYKIGWKSYSEQYLDSTGVFRDAVIAILAAIAKQERVRISERVRAGMQRAYESGKGLGRKPLDISEEKLAELTRLQGEGKSVRQIAASVGMSPASVHRTLKTVSEGVVGIGL